MLRDKTLAGLILAVVLMMTGVGMIVAVLPQRIADLDGNGRSVGYLASAFAFSYLMLQVPIGSLADRAGFKPLLILGYLLCFLAGLVFFFATSSKTIFFARFLQGAGEAPVWALAPAFLSLKFPSAKGQVMGIYNAAMHFGLMLGPISGVALAQVWKNHDVSLIYAFSCLAGAIAIWLLVESPAQAGKPVPAAGLVHLPSLVRLIRQRRILISLLGITLYGAGYGGFITAIPAFLLQEKAFSPAQLGLFFSLFYVAISLSQVITGPLSDRFGRSIFMIWGLLIAAAGIGVTPLFGFPLILPVLAVAGLGAGVFYLASMTFLNESVPDSFKGTVSGAYYLFWGVGMLAGPPIMTEVAAASSFQVSLAGYSFLLLLVAGAMAKTLGWKTPGGCAKPQTGVRDSGAD